MSNYVTYLLTIFAFFLLCAHACTYQENTTGNWDILVKNTPIGDYEGKISIFLDGDEYAGKIDFPGRVSTNVKELKFEGNQASFYFDSPSGYTSYVEGAIENDFFNGTLEVAGGAYEIIGTRVPVNE